jgi:hypothetical protein
MATSKKEASQAGKDLRDSKTPRKDRGPIASALAQAKKPKKQSAMTCMFSGLHGVDADDEARRDPYGFYHANVRSHTLEPTTALGAFRAGTIGTT